MSVGRTVGPAEWEQTIHQLDARSGYGSYPFQTYGTGNLLHA